MTDPPNLLSLARLPLAAAVWIRPTAPGPVLALMALDGLSDLLDGAVARRLAGSGRPRDASLGAWLDPLCDKVFVVSVALALWVFHGVPASTLLLFATRELIQTPAVVAYVGVRPSWRYDFRASPLGKLTTAAQFGAVTALLFHHPLARPLVVASAGLGVLAALSYLDRARRVAVGAR